MTSSGGSRACRKLWQLRLLLLLRRLRTALGYEKSDRDTSTTTCRVVTSTRVVPFCLAYYYCFYTKKCISGATFFAFMLNMLDQNNPCLNAPPKKSSRLRFEVDNSGIFCHSTYQSCVCVSLSFCLGVCPSFW